MVQRPFGAQTLQTDEHTGLQKCVKPNRQTDRQNWRPFAPLYNFKLTGRQKDRYVSPPCIFVVTFKAHIWIVSVLQYFLIFQLF